MLPRAFLLLLSTTATVASASTIIFNVNNPVIGDPSVFAIFQASLTQPTGGGDWQLSINTNYGTTLPGSPTIPAFAYEGFTFGMSDFLITWDGVDYGIVLSAHDGYQAGDLYQVSGYQLSGDSDVMGLQSPNPTVPVLIAAGAGAPIGTGTVSAIATGSNGVSTGQYTVNVSFSAPSDFLDTGDFEVTTSSWVCANGLITGTGDFSGTPEPGTLGLSIPVLFLIGYGARRRRAKSREPRPSIPA